jgi:hypothetical protein
MQYPPLKTIQAVLKHQVDYRARRSATHFRHFFHCSDANGQPTDDPVEIVTIELTQRCKEYYERVRGNSNTA